MTYKTILVHVDASPHNHKRVEIAARLALETGAHLVGTAATGVPGMYYLPGTLGDGNLQLTTLLEMLKERANLALAEFEAIVQKMGLSSYETRIADDEAGVGVSLQARYSDLLVLGQTDPDEGSPAVRDDFPAYVLMNSSRPLLIVPYAGKFDSIGKKVLIAWDASQQATRAVTAAIPLLKLAQSVEVAIFNPASTPQAHGEQPGADIALFLARHGVKVEVSTHVTSDPSRSRRMADLDIGNALLSHAADADSDLIVMGGYAHSRFREVLLGGVTDTILTSMTVPVLLAH